MKKLLKILDALLLIASPIAILFFLIGVIMLPVELSEHPNYLQALEEEGILTDARIDYIYDDGDIHLEFTDQDGKEDYRILKTIYYSPATLVDLKLDTVHTIRYAPQNYDANPALEEHLDEVYAYRQDLSGLYFMLIASWLVIVIRPDFLYVGYIKDINLLFDRKLDSLLNEEGA